MKYIFILFLTLFTTTLSAQQTTETDTTTSVSDSGYVNVHADSRLNVLVSKVEVKEPTKSTGNGNYTGKGYRVQIYNGPDRAKANQTKMNFMKGFPGTRAYMAYKSPNFRIHVGDFKTRAEAQSLLSRLSVFFNAAMIVPDIVTVQGKRSK